MDTSNEIHQNFVKQQVISNIDTELFKPYKAYLHKLQKELIENQDSISGSKGFKYKGKLYATPKDLPTTVVLDESLHDRMDTILDMRNQLIAEQEFVRRFLVKRLHKCLTYEAIYYALPKSLREYYISMYSTNKLSDTFDEPPKDIFEDDINDLVAKCKMMSVLLNG